MTSNPPSDVRIFDNFIGTAGQLATFMKSLVEVQRVMPDIAKGKVATVETKAGGTYTYDYADLSDVSKVLLPLLTKSGFAWSTLPMWADTSRVVLRYMLGHDSGGVLWGDYPINLGGSPQAAGSAITYARRYCLCAVVGAAPKGDDDDATTAPRGTAQRRTPAAKPAAARTAANAAAPDAQKTAQRTPQASGAWSPAQRSKIMASFTDAGIEDRSERLAITSAIVGRWLESSNELTHGDASKVIETLEAVRASGEPFTAWQAKLVYPERANVQRNDQ